MAINAERLLGFRSTRREPKAVVSILSAGIAEEGGVMSEDRPDAWEKAAACEAHANATQDGKLKAMFRRLRDSWIRIGNDAQFAQDVDANARRLDNGDGRKP